MLIQATEDESIGGLSLEEVGSGSGLMDVGSGTGMLDLTHTVDEELRPEQLESLLTDDLPEPIYDVGKGLQSPTDVPIEKSPTSPEELVESVKAIDIDEAARSETPSSALGCSLSNNP